MKPKQLLCIIFLVVVLIVLPGCINQEREARPEEEQNGQEEQVPGNEEGTSMPEGKGEPEKKDEAAALLKEMTLEEKIGQLVMVGFDNTVVDEHIEEMIREKRVGGLILYERNINDAKQLKALIANLKAVNEVNRLPLFIAVDEEGGRISRLPESSPKFPSNLEIGRENDPDYSFSIGKSIGTELKKFGFNMNFAPVLDILSNPENDVIGDRSFGDNPAVVSKLGVATMKGLQSENIVSVVKHFPGHGDTHQDSHIELPVVKHSRERLDHFEFVPFKDAIASGAEAIMTAHIIFPQLDANKPATLSQEILTGILRNEFWFQGLIITDDLEMDAIAENYDLGEAALAAVRAGADIVLVSHHREQQEETLNRLIEAVRQGELDVERVEESVERIIRLKMLLR